MKCPEQAFLRKKGASKDKAFFSASLRSVQALRMYYVYILLCSDGSLYTGSSNNPELRFSDHKNGKGGRYTRSYKPLKLLYIEKLVSKSQALKRESQIKGWSRQKKIRILNLNV